jgi:hypothetical protein
MNMETESRKDAVAGSVLLGNTEGCLPLIIGKTKVRLGKSEVAQT